MHEEMFVSMCGRTLCRGQRLDTKHMHSTLLTINDVNSIVTQPDRYIQDFHILLHWQSPDTSLSFKSQFLCHFHNTTTVTGMISPWRSKSKEDNSCCRHWVKHTDFSILPTKKTLKMTKKDHIIIQHLSHVFLVMRILLKCHRDNIPSKHNSTKKVVLRHTDWWPHPTSQ
jgi:hypothetical protein